MRTTITIDDGLLEDAKRVADELHTTVSALIEEALRARLTAAPTPERPPFRLITSGGDGLQPGVSWDNLSDLDPEVDRFLRAGR